MAQRTQHGTGIGCLAAALLLVLACAAPEAVTGKSVQITSVGWIHQNVSWEYWLVNPPAATQFLDLEVGYSGADLAASDFQSLSVLSPDGKIRWPIALGADNLDPVNRVIRVTLANSSLSANGSVVQSGLYRLELKLRNGATSQVTQDVPPPGQSAVHGVGSVYNEDYFEAKTAAFSPTVRRPLVVSDQKSPSALSVGFRTTDPMAYDGRMYFYTLGGASMGQTDRFRAAGLVLKNDGSLNLAVFTPDQVQLAPGFTWGDIRAGVVTLTDGAQYPDHPGRYDSKSWGPRVVFAPVLSRGYDGWNSFTSPVESDRPRDFAYPVEGTQQALFTKVSAEFTVTAGAPAVGLVFCFQDLRNHYRFTIDPSLTFCRVDKVADGLVTTLFGNSSLEIRQRGTNTVTVEQTSAGMFQIGINGVNVGQMSDSTFAGGASGYAVHMGGYVPDGDAWLRMRMTAPVANP